MKTLQDSYNAETELLNKQIENAQKAERELLEKIAQAKDLLERKKKQFTAKSELLKLKQTQLTELETQYKDMLANCSSDSVNLAERTATNEHKHLALVSSSILPLTSDPIDPNSIGYAPTLQSAIVGANLRRTGIQNSEFAEQSARGMQQLDDLEATADQLGNPDDLEMRKLNLRSTLATLQRDIYELSPPRPVKLPPMSAEMTAQLLGTPARKDEEEGEEERDRDGEEEEDAEGKEPSEGEADREGEGEEGEGQLEPEGEGQLEPEGEAEEGEEEDENMEEEGDSEGDAEGESEGEGEGEGEEED